MTLGDVVAGAGLHVFAEVALVAFFAAFVTILVTTLRRSNRDTFERARLMPLHDGPRAPSADDVAPELPARDRGSDR